MSKKSVYSEYMTVTPKRAEDWLAKSKGNPRWHGKMVDRRRVDAIRRDIENGNWHSGNNSIAFSEDGTLLDGHHRLTAIAEAGKPVDCFVCFNLPKQGERHIDDNAARKISQILRCNQKTASLANLHFKMTDGVSTQASTERVTEFIEKYRDVLDGMEDIFERGKHGVSRNASVHHALFCAMVCGVEKPVIERFVEVINTGFVSGPEEYAASAFRNQMQRHPARSNSERMQASRNAQGAIRDFVKGKSRKSPYNEKTAYYLDKMVEQEKEQSEAEDGKNGV